MSTYELVRNRAALFDFSGEGRFFISGADAMDAINAIIAADLETIPELKALNTILLDEDGALVAILWVLHDENGIWVLCDEDRREEVGRRLNDSILARDAQIRDETESTSCYAIIGALAQEITMAVAGDDIIGIPYLGFEPNAETDTLLCRLGYTGEFDYRFIAPRERASELQTRIMAAGAEYGIEPGDPKELPRLMIEMRSLSQRHHIPEGTDPIQAGLHWMIDFRKEEFPGHDAVHARKTDPGRKALILLLDTENPPPSQTPVLIENQEVGRCAYLVWSPTVGKTVSLAYIDADLAWVGVVFDVAGRDAHAVSAPLFITKTVSAAQ
uniref:Glycine cleavage system T protein (Aminomethyltransferase) n=1 Tax=Candidatus Kentrum sp. UNK TaxID=2126344 RepID=A0A451AAU1_9GAMM|nr:MAG: Glycine cleavage system T protein (aminomethyltransferase) [Candidatus Kentron sp. UNK]VFK71374.1 MAG: Glycine cleavage system T protein (aminomethyltransferase) [Candidatus Kentron sp. UNK]